MLTRQSTIALLALSAGLSVPAVAQNQFVPEDPVLRDAMRRVYGLPSGGPDAAAGPDVIVGEIENTGGGDTTISASANLGGILAYGLGTSSCNISNAANGGQNLLWRSSTPFHPIIPQNMYRLKTVNGSTRFEQIGQSWSKYAFTALTNNVCSLGCNGAGGSVLGMGCSDPYTASRNATQSSAGPRYQCNPFTGVFPDQGQSWRNANWPATTDSTSRRLRVPATDLAPASNPGALYFGEALYINRDDACFGNSKNNASYRRFTFNSGNNSISLVGNQSNPNGTQRMKPAIFAWRDHGNGTNITDLNVMVTEVTCGNTFFAQPAFPYPGTGGSGGGLVLPEGDGWVYVASRATDLGGGVWHYEYAVENLNSDRGIGSFRVNIAPGTIVTNAEIRQIDCHSGVAADDANRNADWVQVVNGTSVSWTSPNTYSASTPELGSYIRWGTMYNFRFDANVAPATGGNAVLGFYKPLNGYVDTINAAAHVPGTPPPPVCYADCDGVGGLTANDFACFLNAYSSGQSYANCDGVGGLTANDFACFLNAYSNGCS